MLNVIELESRWKTYKIKSFIPHVVIASSVLVILIIAYLVFTISTDEEISIKETEEIILPKEKIIVQEENKTIPIEVFEEKIVTKPKDIEPIEQLKQPKQNTNTQKKVTLTPSMHFINEMQNDIPFYQNHDSNYENSSNARDSYKQEKTQKIVEEVEIVEKSQSITIARNTTNDDILKVIERFKKSNDPALSLFVAKKYYELEDYNKSYNYALITNELNNNIEASWIIFAKSLVKLNEKEMAVKTLRQYIEHSGSSQAKSLLEEIRSGRFK